MSLRFFSVAKYTWDTYGVSLHDLKYNTLPKQFLEYEEMMYVNSDYEYAHYKDIEIKT